MKLEGIDPQHPSMYFILTVAEVRSLQCLCSLVPPGPGAGEVLPAGLCRRQGLSLLQHLRQRSREFLASLEGLCRLEGGAAGLVSLSSWHSMGGGIVVMATAYVPRTGLSP